MLVSRRTADAVLIHHRYDSRRRFLGRSPGRRGSDITATSRWTGAPLTLRVQPRSFLDPGPVVPVDSINPGISGYGQTQAYLLSPDYAPNRDRFGLNLLPNPITNGPFCRIA